jgi:hypothetical protein
LAYGIKASTVVQLESVCAGAAAVAALFLWSRVLTREWPLVFAMLLCSGPLVMFFGYPEKGTPKTLALVCWYVYATTLLLLQRSWRRVVASNLFFALAVFSHGSALCWLPAHLWYVWRGGGWRELSAGLLLFALVGAVPLVL